MSDCITLQISLETVRDELIKALVKPQDRYERSLLTTICVQALQTHRPAIEQMVSEAIKLSLSEPRFMESLRTLFEQAMKEAVAAKAKSITASMSQASLLSAMKGGE